MGVANFTWFIIKYKSMGVTKFTRFYKQNLGLSKLFPKKRKQRRVSQTLGLPSENICKFITVYTVLQNPQKSAENT